MYLYVVLFYSYRYVCDVQCIWLTARCLIIGCAVDLIIIEHQCSCVSDQAAPDTPAKGYEKAAITNEADNKYRDQLDKADKLVQDVSHNTKSCFVSHYCKKGLGPHTCTCSIWTKFHVRGEV